MRTNIDINDELMARAMKASRLQVKTKKAVVEEALQMLVRIRAQEGIRDLRGKVKFWDGYDHKAMRESRHPDLNFKPGAVDRLKALKRRKAA